MFRSCLVLLLLSAVAVAQGESIPPKIQALKAGYESAVQRATAPLTKSYLQELQRLKAEYTRAGDLTGALAADSLIQATTASAGAVPVLSAGDTALASMGVEQFKSWLTTVAITEVTGFKNRFTFDGKDFISTKDGAAPRVHQNVAFSVGKIFVPFTSTNATIEIDSTRRKAEVIYSTGQKVEAVIEPKTPAKAR
jgi:hypothetical protein